MQNSGRPITGRWTIPSHPLPRTARKKCTLNLSMMMMKSLLQKRKTWSFSRKCLKVRKVTLSMCSIGRTSSTKRMGSRNLRRFNYHQKSLTWYIIVSRRSSSRTRRRVGEIKYPSIRAWHLIHRKTSDLFTIGRDVTQTYLITSSRAPIICLTFLAITLDSMRL